MAQFGRALGSGPRGRTFKSCHSDQKKKTAFAVFFAFGFPSRGGSAEGGGEVFLEFHHLHLIRVASQPTVPRGEKAFCPVFFYFLTALFLYSDGDTPT